VTDMLDPPPTKLSIWPSHPDFHPSYARVGVILDGVERNDIQWYDLIGQVVRINKTNEMIVGLLQVYWRYPESRQQRRAREVWERKKGYVRNTVGASTPGTQAKE
jgi:hypothetical protein